MLMREQVPTCDAFLHRIAGSRFGHDGFSEVRGARCATRPMVEGQPLKRILVATDFSKGSERAVAVGIELAQAFHATIDLLHVYPAAGYVSIPPVPGLFAAAPSPGELDDIDRELAQLAQRVRDAGVECRTARVEGDPAPMIIEQAATVGGDLIVVGTQGRTGLRRLMIGSVAEATLRHAVTPVLVVPSERPHAPTVPPAPGLAR